MQADCPCLWTQKSTIHSFTSGVTARPWYDALVTIGNNAGGLIWVNAGRVINLLKETAIESIKGLPEGCSVVDIMYTIDLVAQVLEGLKDAEAERLITTEELLE